MWICINYYCPRFEADVSSQFENERCAECGEGLVYVDDL